MSGGVLLSHDLPVAVPSALAGLTSRFGMETGCFPDAMATETLSKYQPKPTARATHHNLLGVVVGWGFWPYSGNRTVNANIVTYRSMWSCRQHPRGVGIVTSPRPISTSQLRTLPRFHFWPINPVVYWGPYPVAPVGDLILKRASRLDAFSGYHSRT